MENEVELKQLHNMLDKILEKKPFLIELKTIFHEIIDDIWNQNDKYIQINSQLSISKTEYIYRYMKEIAKIDSFKKEELPLTSPAMIRGSEEKYELVVTTKPIGGMIKTYISHEIGHIPYLNAIKIYYTKGSIAIRNIIDEGLAEENAPNNPKSKVEKSETQFDYQTEDNMQYTCTVPQTGFTKGYNILTNLFAQLRTILPEEDFEIVKYSPIGALDIFIIEKLNAQVQDRYLCQMYIKRAIAIIDEYLKIEIKKEDEMKREIDEKGFIQFSLEYCYQNLTSIENELLTQRTHYRKWNEEVSKFEAENADFKQNFIQIQRDFFSIMSAKVKKAQNIEEVLKIVGDMEYYKKNMPRIINQRGQDRTKSQIGIFGFERAVADRINDLQLEGKCSALTNSTNTAGEEPDL